MTKPNKYLDKATAAFAVSESSRYDREDVTLGAIQAIAAAAIVIAEELVIANKKLSYIGACLADIADVED